MMNTRINDMVDQTASEFSAVRLSLASPDQIMDWSHGEVTKPETINYRTQKPEKDGLFCEKIFGPTKDWECYCGKYKRIRYKDVVCDKCGVRVTRSIVRRERMGHIALAVPVTHIWFLRGTPSSVGLVLNMSIRDLERVVYFANYIVTSVDEERRATAVADIDRQFEGRKADIMKAHEERAGADDADVKAVAESQSLELAELETTRDAAKAELEGLARLTLLTEGKYRDLNLKYGDVFKAEIGAEAIHGLLADINIDELITELSKESEESTGQKQKKILKRLKMLQGMQSANIDPEWMILKRLPVIPPDLRPMVQLAGGRFAASDLNDLYRRVINRNNRLKRLIELDAPEVIRRNEKRMLQEAVDALFDNNARRERAVSSSTGGRRKLKSLSDMLKGKQGRFRQNLLGKRVDYSGRSVIVSGPTLKLSQVGLPKMMALELFKPFVMSKLIEAGLAHNVKSASRLIERAPREVWDALDEVIEHKFVLLNRAPTLHRLSVQAFRPVLIEGKAIQLHPLVCTAFNADFDGDQMAVHLPLSDAAQKEAGEIMLATKNLLRPADGATVVNPSQDMVLGCYYLTYEKFGETEPAKHFSSFEEAIQAHEQGVVKLQTKITAPVEGERTVTTVGRIIFNEMLPKQIAYKNETMTKKALQAIVAEVFVVCGQEVTAELVDHVKDLGFKYATQSGISIGFDDFIAPESKHDLVDEGEKHVVDITRQFEQGLITDDERYRRTIEAWRSTNDKVKNVLETTMADSDATTWLFVESGARGDLSQVNQISGMIGLVNNPTGRIIELPIRSSYKEGLTSLEYFSSTHGARKGLSDTALKTAESGYLTRRLVDVSQDIIVQEADCGDKVGVVITRRESQAMGESLAYRLAGRFTAKTVKSGDKIVAKAGTLITDALANAIVDDKAIDEVTIRSALSCQTSWGICQKCYGTDLARGRLVKLGEPVGVIAAQSIGEPGTQLTMRTFHKGVAAGGADITSGLPRVEEIFEARAPKGQAVLAELDGVVTLKEASGKTVIRVAPANLKTVSYELGERIAEVKTGDEVKVGDIMAADAKGKKLIKAKYEGTVEVTKEAIHLTHAGDLVHDHSVPNYQSLEVQNGDAVVKGQRLTEGSINLQDMLALQGEAAVQRYIISEVQSIYSSQGQTIADKHIEIIIRQMFSRVTIEEPGDSLHVTGDIVSRMAVVEDNHALEAAGKKPATYEQMLLSITKISVSSDSFLSAASFQDTTRVLIGAATKGKLDKLRGLKENVIIGRLTPIGTGFGLPVGGVPEPEVAVTATAEIVEDNVTVDSQG